MKILHINMTAVSIFEEQVPEQYANLGGRGLTSVMINDLVPADCDPLGKDNLLVFAPGFPGGTPLAITLTGKDLSAIGSHKTYWQDSYLEDI